VTTATIRLWGTPIGYVSMDHGERFARFEYDPDFVAAGIEVAPLQIPLRSAGCRACSPTACPTSTAIA
jgi:serine/threonine-protein kinase HipA